MAQITSAANLTRLLAIILGAVVAGLVYYSYFSSLWVDEDGNKLCAVLKEAELPITCPSIIMERYFISVVIICPALSIAWLYISLANFHVIFRYADAAYNVISTMAMISGGVLYIFSARQIKEFFEELEESGIEIELPGQLHLYNSKISRQNFENPVNDKYLRHEEKFASGSLAIFNGVLYLLTAVLVLTQRISKETGTERKKLPPNAGLILD